MGADTIDEGSAVPKYQQLAAILRARIQAGEFYGENRRLPPEGALQVQYGVARDTVRRALDQLRYEGLIVTYPGTGSEAVPPG